MMALRPYKCKVCNLLGLPNKLFNFVQSSNIEEVPEVHEMHGRFDLFVKIRTTDLEQSRNVIENKTRGLSNIVDTQLVTILKTKKEEQVASLDIHITESNG